MERRKIKLGIKELCFGALLFLFYFCSSAPKPNVKVSQIEAIKFRFSIDNVDLNTGKVFVMKDSLYVFDFDKFIILKLRQSTLNSEHSSNPSIPVKEYTTLYTAYVLYQRHALKGFLYDSAAMAKPQEISMLDLQTEDAFKRPSL